MKKRIALGVVAALAGGLLAAAPASAAASITVTPKPAYRAGVAATIAVTGSGTTSLKARVDYTSDATALPLTTSAATTVDASSGIAIATGWDAGSYTFTVYDDVNGNSTVDSGEATAPLTVVLGGTPVYASLTTTSTIYSGQKLEFTVALYDSGDRKTMLSGVESLTVFSDSATVTKFTNAATGASDTATIQDTVTSGTVTDTVTVIAANVGYYGWSAFARTSSHVGTAKLYVKYGTGGAMSTLPIGSATSTTTYKSVTVKDIANATKVEIVGTTGLTGSTGDELGILSGTNSAETWLANPATDGTVTFKITGSAAGDVVKVAVDSTVNKLADSTSFVTLGVDKTVTTSVAMPTPTAGTTGSVAQDTYTFTVGGGWVYTIKYTDNVPVVTVKAPLVTTLLKGGVVDAKFKVTDTFGNALASQPVTIAVSGRNTAATTATSDASGYVTYKYTDAGTTATATADSVVVSATNTLGTGTATLSISYVTALKTPATVNVATGSTSVQVDQQEETATYPTTYATVTAQVLDSTGVPVGAGHLVTFSGSADDLFVGGVNSSATGTDGKASVKVYRHKTGTTSIKATVGTISGVTEAMKWTNDTTTARTLTLSGDPASAVAGGIIRVVAKVVDRWGNGVQGIQVTFAENGVGRVHASSSTTPTTDVNGVASMDLTSLDAETGDNTVSASISTTGNQSDDLAGYVDAVKIAGVAAGVYEASTKVSFTAKAAAAADPTVTALVTQVQSLIVSVNAIIASMTRSIAATNTQIAKLVAAIAKLTKK